MDGVPRPVAGVLDDREEGARCDLQVAVFQGQNRGRSVFYFISIFYAEQEVHLQTTHGDLDFAVTRVILF